MFSLFPSDSGLYAIPGSHSFCFLQAWCLPTSIGQPTSKVGQLQILHFEGYWTLNWLFIFSRILNRFMGIQGQISTPAHSRQPAGCTAILLFGKLQHVLVRDVQLQQQSLQIRCKLFRFLQLRKMLDYNKDSKHFEFVLQCILLNISRCNLWYCNREACNSEQAKLQQRESTTQGTINPWIQCIDYFRCFFGVISCKIYKELLWIVTSIFACRWKIPCFVQLKTSYQLSAQAPKRINDRFHASNTSSHTTLAKNSAFDRVPRKKNCTGRVRPMAGKTWRSYGIVWFDFICPNSLWGEEKWISRGDVPSQDVKIWARNLQSFTLTKLTLFHQTTCQTCAIESFMKRIGSSPRHLPLISINK